MENYHDIIDHIFSILDKDTFYLYSKLRILDKECFEVSKKHEMNIVKKCEIKHGVYETIEAGTREKKKYDKGVLKKHKKKKGKTSYYFKKEENKKYIHKLGKKIEIQVTDYEKDGKMEYTIKKRFTINSREGCRFEYPREVLIEYFITTDMNLNENCDNDLQYIEFLRTSYYWYDQMEKFYSEEYYIPGDKIEGTDQKFDIFVFSDHLKKYLREIEQLTHPFNSYPHILLIIDSVKNIYRRYNLNSDL